MDIILFILRRYFVSYFYCFQKVDEYTFKRSNSAMFLLTTIPIGVSALGGKNLLSRGKFFFFSEFFPFRVDSILEERCHPWK